MTVEMVTPAYLGDVLKWASAHSMSAELVGGQYSRRGHLEPREIPAEERRAYERARELLTELAANPCIRQGVDGGLIELELVEPDDTTWVWDETEDEHAARLRALGPITIPVRTKAPDHNEQEHER